MPSPFEEIECLLDTMQPISLEEMGKVRLMNRVDEKYLLDIKMLQKLIERIAPQYYVQRIDGKASAAYHTLYFDTEDLAMYTMHHNRKLNRKKLRVRTYEQSGTTFFELKNKLNTGKTKKKRIEIPLADFESCLANPEVAEFVMQRTPYSPDQLKSQLENRFERITLVDKDMQERVTIDSGLCFTNRTSLGGCCLEGLVVMEVKHEVSYTDSAIGKAMLELRIHPRRMSKYCIGTALTNPAAKANRFKSKLRYIGKLCSINKYELKPIEL